MTGFEHGSFGMRSVRSVICASHNHNHLPICKFYRTVNEWGIGDKVKNKKWASVTRLGDFCTLGNFFKAFGNN